MERGRALREGARLAALAVLAGAFPLAAACAPLELDLTDGEAGPPDSTVPDVTVPGDATMPDTGRVADSAPAADGSSADGDADAGADADGSVQPLPCSKTADCADASQTPLCNQEGGVCVQCLSASDCGKGNAPHCVSNVCIACQTNADCNDGGTEGGMACNTFIPRCASTCSAVMNCMQSGQTGGLYCNLSAGYCVECTDNTYCVNAATGTHCYLAAGVCGCVTGADCPSTAPTCGPKSTTDNHFCQK
jgi:hypothetical protein